MSPGRRLAKYLYVADLLRRPRVLEIGAGDGTGCRFLSERGAREVLGLETSEALVRAGYQRPLPRGVSLKVGTFRPLELPDRAYDLVLVPEAGELLRADGFLEDVRRVLRPDGALVMGVPAGDDSAAVYQEVLELLEPLFGPTRMIGLAAFGGFALSEYSQPGDDMEGEVALDASLVEAAGEDAVVEYLAVAGDRAEQRRGYLVVEVPAEPEAAPSVELTAHQGVVREAEARIAALENHVSRRDELLARGAGERLELDRRIQLLEHRLAEAQAAAREPDPRLGEHIEELVASLEDEREARAELLAAASEHARREADLQGQVGEQSRYAEELERDLRRANERVRELATSLGAAQRKLEDEATETRKLRSRVAAFEGAELASRLRGDAPPPDAGRIAALERDLEKANLRWRTAEDKTDELWRKVGNAEKEAVEAREGAAKRALEQKGVHQQNVMRAVEEAGRKLASAQDETSRERRDALAARADLALLRADLAASREELTALEASCSARDAKDAELVAECVRMVAEAEERAIAAELAFSPSS